MKKEKLRLLIRRIAQKVAYQEVNDMVEKLGMGMSYLSDVRGDMLELRGEFFDKIDELELRIDGMEEKK